MTSCSRGDVVLVRFVFADEKGTKQRPGLVVSTDRYHQGRQEAILAAITSNVGRVLVGDHRIKAWREAGLLYPSIDGDHQNHQTRHDCQQDGHIAHFGA